MSFDEKVGAFVQLGNVIDDYVSGLARTRFFPEIENCVIAAEANNPWFTKENILSSLKGISKFLQPDVFEKIRKKYPVILETRNPKKIAVIMAGNIPLVGFHDFMTVLLSGHLLGIKASSKDNILLKCFAKIVTEINSGFKNQIVFYDGVLSGIDAVIATGSNNSSRYFEYYFGKYPHIIRHNRNSIAILNGTETQKQLDGLANDIFLYFGLGCRNVSKIYVPENYNFTTLFQTFEKKSDIKNHNKYFNNYEYQRAVYLVNKTPHLENGFVILKEDSGISSPVSVIFYEYYSNVDELIKQINSTNVNIQCKVSAMTEITGCIPFGESQFPDFFDFADNIDTFEFLLKL